MMSLPLITIIIPTLNVELTLERALGSVVSQSYLFWEVILVDGGSTDKTLAIAKKYKNLFSNMIYIYSEKDEGIYDAMNKGISKSNGEWVYFLGADDFLFSKNTLESVLEVMEKGVYDVIYGDVVSNLFKIKYAGKFNYSRFEKQNICHQAIFFNKKVFRKIGDFNLKYKVLADWEHNIRWFYNSDIKNIYIDLIIANYSGDGFSSNNIDELFEINKPKIMLIKGRKFLGLNKLIGLCTKIINENRKENNNFKVLYYSMFRFYLRSLRKLKINK